MACCGGGGCGCSSMKGVQDSNMNGDLMHKRKELTIDSIQDETLLQMLKGYFTNDDTQDKDKASKIEKQIYHQYKSVYPKSTLVRIVETLAFALTDGDVGNRAKGTSLLAESIFQCVPSSMNNLEINTLVRFFCDRLRDHHSIQPIVIYAFLGLLSYQNVSNDLIITLLQGIFAEVHVQSLLQADRRNVFNIFSNLLKTKPDLLQSISSDFVFGYIQAMDGEKDPRNLQLCFENCHLLIQHVDIKLFAEDLFEILSCYFPIEFREPKDDQFRIKRVDLVLALRKCLCATPLFGPYSIPLYVEKLSSDLIDSKLDALTTFMDSLSIYKPEDIALHIDDIWLAIRKDYLLSDFPDLGPTYLDFIYKLFVCLSSLNDSEPIMKMVKFLTTDITQTLRDPEMTITESCGNVILKTCNASDIVYKEIKEKVIPLLQGTLQKYTSPFQRTKTLEMIANVLAVNATRDKTEDEKLMQFVLYLLPILYENIASSDTDDLKVISLKCIENVVSKSSYFKSIDYDLLCQHSLSLTHKTLLSVSVIAAYKSFIKNISFHFPQLFTEHFLQFLLTNFDNISNDLTLYNQHMQLLESTSLVNDDVRNSVFMYFNTILKKSTQVNLVVVESALECFLSMLKKTENTMDGDVIISPLLHVLEKLDFPEASLCRLCYAFSESYNHLSSGDQVLLCDYVKSILLNKPCNGSPFGKVQLSFSLHDQVYKFSFLVRGILTQIPFVSVDDTEVLCKGLKNIMQANGNDETVLDNFGMVFGSLVNKVPSHKSFINSYLDQMKDNVLSGDASGFVLDLLKWIVKSLVLNWQSSTTIAIDLLLACLKNEKLSAKCVKGFASITTTDDFVFSKRAKAIIKPIHKQRYAAYVLPLLIESYNVSQGETKSYHMMAISNTLDNIPEKMLKKYLKELMPLLMHSLSTCTSDLITESTLSTIFPLIRDHRDNQDEIMNYVPSLLSRLIEFLSSEKMSIRILALKCLSILSSYSIIVVQPIRGAVLKALPKLLDDPKRLVRKEAVNCSNFWHLMGSGD